MQENNEKKTKLKLDIRDRKILSELDLNARQPLSKIAKKLKISKQVVDYRINKLIENGVINGFYTVVNIHKIGYIAHRITLKLQNITIEKEKEIIEYLKKYPSIGWVFSLNGRWDMSLTIYTQDIIEFGKKAREILYEYVKYISDKHISIVTELYHFKNNFLYPTKDLSEAYVGGKIENVILDEFDFKILKMLSLDARVPLVKIAKELEISPRTVNYRTKNLIKKGIIKSFRVNINTGILDYEHYKIFLYLQNLTEEKERQLIYYFKEHPNIIYCTKAVGIADIEFEMKVKSIEKFYEIMNDLRQRFPDIIKDYETLLIFKEHLINYFPFESELEKTPKSS